MSLLLLFHHSGPWYVKLAFEARERESALASGEKLTALEALSKAIESVSLEKTLELFARNREAEIDAQQEQNVLASRDRSKEMESVNKNSHSSASQKSKVVGARSRQVSF